MHQRKGNYWYMLPEYGQARKAMWDALNPNTGRRRIDDAFPVALRKTVREQEMMIVSHFGSTFQLVGSDSFNSLVGSPPIGLILSEYALSNPSAWAYLMPIIEENNGWVIFNSTPRGKNHFKGLCELAEKEREAGRDWFYEALRADQTGVFTKDQLGAILREMQALHGEDFGKALFEQEYYVSFDAAIPGSIWGDLLRRAEQEGRIGDFAFDPQFPVHTAWDLGRTDDTAIWFFQLILGDIKIIDFHASSLKEIDFYADLLRGTVKSGDSEDLIELKSRAKRYQYGTHWVPHDARPTRMGMGGKSILQQFQEHEVGRFVLVPNLDVQEGIQAARKTLPRCYFNEDTCEKGLEALKSYHREWDDEKKIFLDKPVHDWASHPADAFRYLSLVWSHPKTKETSQALTASPSEIQRLIEAGIPNFGQLKERHFARKRAERDYVH